MRAFAVLSFSGDPYPTKTIAIRRGDAAELSLKVYEVDGEALNLNDYRTYFTVKSQQSQADSAAVMQKTTGSGINTLDGLGAEAIIAINNADTVNLGAQSQVLYYDVQIEYLSTGAITTVADGTFLVEPDTTLAA